MDDYDYDENSIYIGENLKEILKEIAHRARVSVDVIEDDLFNYDYVDSLIYSIISGCIQLSFYVLVRKIYEKRYLNKNGGM